MFTINWGNGAAEVAEFEIVESEGDLASLTCLVKNPRRGLRSTGFGSMASFEKDGAPLFLGRVVALPADMAAELLEVVFIAQPSDYDDRKGDAVSLLREAPFWDPVWIDPNRREDPDTAIEARTDFFYCDRVSHGVSVESMISGSGGTVTFGADDIVAGSLALSFGEPPLTRVRVQAGVMWTQVAAGSIDLTGSIVAAGGVTDTDQGYTIRSFTGQGLYDDWPNEGGSIGGGWEFGPCPIRNVVPGKKDRERFIEVWTRSTARPEPLSTAETIAADGGLGNYLVGDVNLIRMVLAQNGEAKRPFRFPLWYFYPGCTARYSVANYFSETLVCDVTAEVQSLLADPGTTGFAELSLSSGEVGLGIDAGGALPIGDLRRNEYFPTDRGRQSLEYAIMAARAMLLRRARAANIVFETSFARAQALNLTKNVTVTAPQLPGGTATGKVTSVVFGSKGGKLYGEVHVGCMIGLATVPVSAAGDPLYGEDGYGEPGYSQRSGVVIVSGDSDVSYSPPDSVATGVDFFNLGVLNALDTTGVQVLNGEAAQRALLKQPHEDIAAVIEALNAIPTMVDVSLIPVQSAPQSNSYSVSAVSVFVPSGINLSAA